MARRGVHEAGAGVVSDVVAGEQRHVEIIAACALQRMRADSSREHRRRNVLHLFIGGDTRLLEHICGELVSEDEGLAHFAQLSAGASVTSIEP